MLTARSPTGFVCFQLVSSSHLERRNQTERECEVANKLKQLILSSCMEAKQIIRRDDYKQHTDPWAPSTMDRYCILSGHDSLLPKGVLIRREKLNNQIYLPEI